MNNVFAPLRPALELITAEGQVLAATGQAREDLTQPDHEEVLDHLRMGDREAVALLEAPNHRLYVPLRPLHRRAKHFFRYFLDGSARTFFLGTVLEHNRQTPVHIAQIGAAAVVRDADGQVRVGKSVHRIILMMDEHAVSFGQRVRQLIESAGERYKFLDTAAPDGETELTSAGKDQRTRPAHKAHHLMAEHEEQLGRSLDRPEDAWLIIDGSLGKDLHRWASVPKFVGVTKSFSRDVQFRLPEDRRTIVNLFQLICELPPHARTCGFGARDNQVVFWYTRLRPQQHLDYPLMGVIKIELFNKSAEAVDSHVIDEISSALVAERIVTPHGRDNRWHAHLYPVFLAEQAVKTGFLSSEVLKAGMKWPMHRKHLQ